MHSRGIDIRFMGQKYNFIFKKTNIYAKNVQIFAFLKEF